MRNACELRDRAARYVALAITARRNGGVRLAGMLMDRAADLMEDAEAVEAGQIIPRPQREAMNVQHQQQHQQQIQWKDDSE